MMHAVVNHTVDALLAEANANIVDISQTTSERDE